MNANQPQTTMQVQHGHTDTHVAVVFPRPVANLLLTPEQAEHFIASMQGSLKNLREHQVNPKPLPSQGPAANG